MSWIKIRTNLHEDPRIVQIASELGVDELCAIGCCWRAWSWADIQSVDGNALTVTEKFLDRLVRRDGFALALRKVGWLEGRDGLLSFPRFAEHNGQTAKSRAVTSKRVAEHRNGAGVTSVTVEALPEKRREEKSREDKNKLMAAPLPTDSDWLATLKANPGYAGIEIDREFGKATAWAENKHRKCTRKFFLNWINRAEKPMQGQPTLEPRFNQF